MLLAESKYTKLVKWVWNGLRTLRVFAASAFSTIQGGKIV